MGLTKAKLVQQLGVATREIEALREKYADAVAEYEDQDLKRQEARGNLDVARQKNATLQAENAALKLEVERVTLGAVLMSHRWNKASAAFYAFSREFAESVALVAGNERTRQMEKRYLLAAVIEDMKATEQAEDPE